MLWPTNQKRYEKLKSTFTDIEALVNDLMKSGFSGYLEIRLTNAGYYLLVRPKAPIQIYMKDNTSGKFYVVPELSVSRINEESKIDTAYIDVYDVEPERLDLLLGYLSAVPLYKDLSSEFTDFEKLINKLTRDTLSGYLEIIFDDASINPAYVFYDKGKVKDVSWGEQQFSGNSGVNELKLKMEDNEAQFNVYQNVGQESSEGTEDKSKNEEFYDNNRNGNRDFGKVKLDMEEAVEGAPPENLKKPEKKAKKTRVHDGRSENQFAERVEKKLENFSIQPYLDFTGALIKWVEDAVNKQKGKNYFSRVFKKGLLNVSDRYPFLDPFLAEFDYADGEIKFENEINVIEFLKGIYSAIIIIFEEMKERERNEIDKILKKTLIDLEREYRDEIEILRVRTLMPTLFQ